MLCPRDESELIRTEIEGLALDSCPECQGLWFDAGELEEARDHADPDIAWLDFDLWRHPESFALGQASSRCPRCSEPMCRTAYGDTGAEMDACPFCHGVWLEERELDDIVMALESEAREKTLPELLLTSLAEALDMVRHPSHAARDWRDLKQVLRLARRRLFAENKDTLELLVRASRSTPLS